MNSKRTFITFILINISVVVVAFLFFYFFIVQIKKAESKAIIEQYQVSMVENLNQTILDAFEDFEYLTNHYELEYLSQYVSENASIRRFVYFLEYQEAGFKYLDFNISFKDYNLADYNFGFFDNYFYLFNQEIVAISKINTVFGQILAQSSSNNAFLMNKNGLIYFHRETEITTKALHEYLLAVDTTDYFHNEFKNGQEVYIETKINDDKVNVKFSPLKDYPALYIGQVFLAQKLSKSLFKYNIIYGSILAIVLAGNIVLQIFVYRRYYLQDTFFGGLVQTKAKTNSLLLVLNDEGEIIRTSKNVQRILPRQVKYHINDFVNLSSDSTPFQSVLNGENFNININHNIIRFHVLKKGKLKFLLGEIISDNDELESV